MFRRPIVFALLALAPTVALADPLPTHIQWQVKLLVQPADAVAVVVVDEAKLDSKAGTVVLEVMRKVAGEVPQSVEVPAAGFAREDLVPGTQLLVPLKQRLGGEGWFMTGRYELVYDGKVREYELEGFLAYTAAAASEVLSQRAQRTSGRAFQPVRRKAKIIVQTRPCEDFTPANGC